LPDTLLFNQLSSIFKILDGFYAFESALHFYSSKQGDNEINIVKWNSPDLWIDAYGELIQDLFFFAEDIFGDQFCIKDNYIYI